MTMMTTTTSDLISGARILLAIAHLHVVRIVTVVAVASVIRQRIHNGV